jgi:ribosomal protein L11 methyltransferase
MSRDWIEVSITSQADAGELLGFLGDRDVTGAWQENGRIHLYWPADRWSPALVEELQQALRRLSPESERSVIQVAAVPDRDWNEQWARTVTPIRIGRRLVVRPSWAGADEVALRPGEIELVLDPKQAFGTGHHATTQLLVEWLEEVVRGGERLLDVGTGSGILAMVAIRLGAASALGIDHDPVSIDCAREYAAVNKFGPELTFQMGTLEQVLEGQFDLIVANLDRGTLLESVDRFAPFLRRGARLLISGLLVEDRLELAQAFAAAGGAVRSWREREGWLALDLVAPESCEGAGA